MFVGVDPAGLHQPNLRPNPAPTEATKISEPTLLPSLTAELTLASLPDGGIVYGDPGDRFSLPLVGEWKPIETVGAYGHFTPADPALELYVVTVESEDLEVVAKTALTKNGVVPSALSQLAIVPLEHRTVHRYADDSDGGVTLAARQLDGATIAVILSGELSVTTSPPAEAFLSLDGLVLMPLAEYLRFQPPPAPTTIEAIDNLNHVEYYSGGSKLVGRLVLPDGDGPFPAIVFVHGAGPAKRHKFDTSIPTLTAAGLAYFEYDKR